MRRWTSSLGVDSQQFWQLLWPPLIAIVALRALSFPLPPGWNPSLVPAPGVSMFDAVIFFWAGFDAARRVQKPAAAIVCAVVTGIFGFLAFLVYAAIATPSLLLVPFKNPFIFLILAVLFAIAVAFAAAVGAAGATIGRRWSAAPQLADTLETPN